MSGTVTAGSLLVGVGGWLWLTGAQPVAPEPRIIEAPTVEALGRIEPLARILTIVPPTGTDQARIATLNVHEGEEVRTGQVLATMDTAVRQKAVVDLAAANLDVARFALDRTRIESANQITNGAAAVERWKAERDKAASDLDRASRLAGAGFGPHVNEDQSRVALAQAQQQLEQSSVALERAKATGSSGKLLDVESAEGQVASARAQLEQSQALYKEAQVPAPSDGQVLRIFARVGERGGEQGIMEFGQTAVMAIRAEVYATDSGRLALGQEATATSPGLRAPLHGAVAEITPMVEKQSIVSADPAADTDARIVNVRIRLDEGSSGLAKTLSNLEVRVSIAANGRTAAALVSANRP